jgi:hypothetical protein
MVDKPEAPTETPKPTPKDNLVITQHTVNINGQEIHYTVTTGTIVLKEEAEKKATKKASSRVRRQRRKFSLLLTPKMTLVTKQNAPSRFLLMVDLVHHQCGCT